MFKGLVTSNTLTCKYILNAGSHVKAGSRRAREWIVQDEEIVKRERTSEREKKRERRGEKEREKES